MLRSFSPEIHMVASSGGCVAQLFGLPCPLKKMNPQPLLMAFMTSRGPERLPSDVQSFFGMKLGI